VIPLREHTIVEGLLYRLIRKHIAGTTMSSAISKARELNGKKLPVSIVFLSDSARDGAKARYATTTYLELIRRIARMGLKASVHVPMGQVGMGISEDVASRNVSEILATANRYGVFVWLEVVGVGSVRGLRFLKDAKGMGYAVGIKDSNEYLNRNGDSVKALKIICSKAESKEESSLMEKRIRFAADSTRNVVLQSAPESVVNRLVSGGKYRKSLIFEFQLGYNAKAMGRLIKRGAKASVYVPFGKDWTQYAVNNVPESYARFLASKLLGERKETAVAKGRV
jgi:proline dehydrogenase